MSAAPETTLSNVQVDGQVVLKIVKHNEIEGGDTDNVCMGALLGMVVKDTLEVTNCYPFPKLGSADHDFEDTSAYQHEMTRRLRELKNDYLNVGWYDTARHGNFFNRNLVESQFVYQEFVVESVVIVYDPLKTSQGRLSLRAFRLSRAALENFRESDFSPENVRRRQISYDNLFEEIPVTIRNSHLINLLINEIDERSPPTHSFQHLQLTNEQCVEKEMQLLISSVDDLCQECNKLNTYHRNVAKQAEAKKLWLHKRRSEGSRQSQQQQAVSLRPPNEEEQAEMARVFKPVMTPTRLDALVVSGQIATYTGQLNGAAADSLGKLFLTEWLGQQQQSRLVQQSPFLAASGATTAPSGPGAPQGGVLPPSPDISTDAIGVSPAGSAVPTQASVPSCGNVNFSKRNECNRCGAAKEEGVVYKKGGAEIGKSMADRSGGLFSAEDWMCKTCGNVNWARRMTCNMCNAPKFAKEEARLGLGGGYMERDLVVEKEVRDESDSEYDEFGRKKKKYRGVSMATSILADKPPPPLPKPEEQVEQEEEEEEDDEDGDLSKYDLWGEDEEEEGSKPVQQTSDKGEESRDGSTASNASDKMRDASPQPLAADRENTRPRSRSRSRDTKTRHSSSSSDSRRSRSRSPSSSRRSRSRSREVTRRSRSRSRDRDVTRRSRSRDRDVTRRARGGGGGSRRSRSRESRGSRSRSPRDRSSANSSRRQKRGFRRSRSRSRSLSEERRSRHHSSNREERRRKYSRGSSRSRSRSRSRTPPRHHRRRGGRR